MLRKLSRLIKMIWSDPFELGRYYLNGTADILFYCSTPIDEVWTRHTFRECQKRNIKCAIIISDKKKDSEKNSYTYCASRLFLRLAKCKIMVTSTSGVPKTCMPLWSKYNIHMPHSFVSLHVIYPENAFDGYNVIFSCGPHHDIEVMAYNKAKAIKDRVTFPIGYGKFDVLEEGIRSNHISNESQKLILIAPSWGKNNILESIGNDLISNLIQNQYKVVVRPHPSFFIHNNEILHQLQNSFQDKIQIEDSTSTDKTIYHADLLITDYSGIGFEYALLKEKPVLFINVAQKIFNPNWKELDIPALEVDSRKRIGEVCEPNIQEVMTAIDSLITYPERYINEIREFKKTDVYNYGKCAKNAVDQLEKLLGKI